MINGSRILVTGGTGSFGNAFIDLVFKTQKPKEVVVFSRDEKKQYDMRVTLNNPKVSFLIGDVRDRNVINNAMEGIDFVFHAAALKQVPSCEFFPIEAVKTNVLGTDNVLAAAKHHKVKKVVVLSTDKAVYPINAMGMSKALMEKIMIANARLLSGPTVFCGVRYGNVMYSRGSVIPLFIDQIRRKQPLTLTHPDMTRFLLPLSQAVELVLFALDHGNNGDLFIRKAPAATIGLLAQSCKNLFASNSSIVTVGIREGEKMHETLVTREELLHAEEFDNYFRIPCDRKLDYEEYFTKGKAQQMPADGYTSANTRQLDLNGTEALIKSLPEIQKELP